MRPPQMVGVAIASSPSWFSATSWKESGLGREGTVYAMDEMTDIKHLVINYN